jgi:phosphatidylinositol kinase/protein kinase (PI-3  family)
MIVYLSDPKNSTRELLKLINNFSKVAGYKINSNKSVAFLYSKDKQGEKEIRETTLFTIVTNNIKYLGMTLTNQVKDLYEKNFKSLKKEIEEDFRRWKDLPCLWIGRINIVKFQLIELERTICKFIWNNQKPRIVKTILNKRTSGEITISDLKLYYRAIVIEAHTSCNHIHKTCTSSSQMDGGEGRGKPPIAEGLLANNADGSGKHGFLQKCRP